MFWTVSLLPMERLGSVVYDLLRHISPQISGVERGRPKTATGLYWYCCKQFHFISDTKGEVSRVNYKARFVDKGYSQRVSLFFSETFSPLIRMAGLRMFLAIAAAMDLDLCQLGIRSVFVCPITEDVDMCYPLRFSDETPKVCHLKRCSTASNNSPASSTCCCGTGLFTFVGGNNVSLTRASTSSALNSSSLCLPCTWMTSQRRATTRHG
jgi:hypothetical protein